MNTQRKRENQRNYLYQHKRMGLCVQCNNIAISGSILCRQHSRYPTNYDKAMWKNRKDDLHCPDCAIPLIEDQGLYCFHCQTRKDGQLPSKFEVMALLFVESAQEVRK